MIDRRSGDFSIRIQSANAWHVNLLKCPIATLKINYFGVNSLIKLTRQRHLLTRLSVLASCTSILLSPPFFGGSKKDNAFVNPDPKATVNGNALSVVASAVKHWVTFSSNAKHFTHVEEIFRK